MQPIFQSDFKIPENDEVPFEARQAVLEHIHASHQSSAKEIGSNARKFLQIVEKRTKALEDLLGRKKYQRLREFVNEQRRLRAEKSQPAPGAEISDEETNSLRQQQKESSLKFLRDINISVDQLQAINSRFGKQIESLVSRPSGDQMGQLVLPADIPESIRQHKTNPWTVKKPPYDGWENLVYSWKYGGYSLSCNFYVDMSTGLTGSYNYLAIQNPGDFDGAQLRCDSTIAFWYKVPVTGLLEVWIEGQVGENTNSLRHSDEFGWSECSTEQEDFLVMKIVGGGGKTPGKVRESLVCFSNKNALDGYWFNHFLPSGNIYWAQLFSDIPYKAGEWVLVQAGTRTNNFNKSNDVEIDSSLLYKWFIKSVWVDSTG